MCCLLFLLCFADCTAPGPLQGEENNTEIQQGTEDNPTEPSSENIAPDASAETQPDTTQEDPPEQTQPDQSPPEPEPATESDEQLPPESTQESTQETSLSCTQDCDCVAVGKVCEGGRCEALRRLNNCPACDPPGMCKAGQPCLQKDGGVGVCPDISCQSDCDCFASGQVCDASTQQCAPLKRANTCPSCSGAMCPKDSDCYNDQAMIEKCPGSGMGAACQHDCDCVKYGLLCNGPSGCAALRRLSNCLTCTDPNCKSGDPCVNPDKSIGMCRKTTTCQHDCDCVKLGQVCNASTQQCAPLRRVSNCASCTSPGCQRGDPCQNTDGSIGSCCCNVSGCPQGQLCCPGGPAPAPGTCGRFCLQPAPNGGCPLLP